MGFQVAFYAELLLNGFNLDVQLHLVADHALQEVHAPLAAVDGGSEIAAAYLGVDALAVVAVKAVGVEAHGVGLAEQGKAAVHAGELAVAEVEAGGFKAHAGILGGIE